MSWVGGEWNYLSYMIGLKIYVYIILVELKGNYNGGENINILYIYNKG